MLARRGPSLRGRAPALYQAATGDSNPNNMETDHWSVALDKRRHFQEKETGRSRFDPDSFSY